jgi:hypothetical protein
MTRANILRTSMLGLFAVTISGLPLLAQNDSPKMTSNHTVAFAVSPPLRDIAGLRLNRHYDYGLPEEDVLDRLNSSRGSLAGHAVDPVEQDSPGLPASISVGLSIPGLMRDFGQTRPDTNAAVGDTQLVEWENVEYSVYNKSTGALEVGPIDGSMLWQSLGGPCYENNDGDVIAQFDKVHHRWLMAQNDFNLPEDQPPYYACVAVSTSDDATGTYYLYQFPEPNFPDYPKWGIWPTGYFQTQNAIDINTGLVGAYVCAYNSAKLIVGDQSAEQICFQLTVNDYALLPGDIDSRTPPPANQDEFFIGSYDVDQTNNHLYLYSMHPDFANPSQSTFAGAGLADPITVPTYIPYCAALSDSCVPQQGTPTRLASLGIYLMYRLAYWNDGPLGNVGTHATRAPAQHWYVNHVTTASGGQAGVRWYEFRAPVRTATISDVRLYQSGTFAPDLNYRWLGSIAQDKMGNIALGYNLASTTVWDSIAVTGRVPSDSLGQMEAETIVARGSGSQGGNPNWGDYSSMAIDSDGCTFWYAQEYYVTPASVDWQTQLTSFKFNGCQ